MNVATSARGANSTSIARDQLSTSTKPQSDRSIPSSARERNFPQSTWACSPGAVSNRTVALGGRTRRYGSTYSFRIVSPPA